VPSRATAQACCALGALTPEKVLKAIKAKDKTAITNKQ